MATKKNTKQATAENPELEAAWQIGPHLENIRAARAHVSEYRQGREEPAGVGAVSSAVVEALLAGEPVPKDLPERIRAAIEAEEIYQRETAVLLNVVRSVEHSEDRVRARAAHAGLGRLHDRVVEIVEGAAATAGVLGDVASADAALEAGAEATEAWRELTQLAGQYRQVRDAQRVLVNATGSLRIHGSAVNLLAVGGEFREYARLWPYWNPMRRTGVPGDHWSSPRFVPPWPHREGGAPTRDAVFLLWAARQDTNPLWVPSVEAMTEAWRAASQGSVESLEDPEKAAKREAWEERMDTVSEAVGAALGGSPSPAAVAKRKKKKRRAEQNPGEARIRDKHARVQAGFGPGQSNDLAR